MLFSDCRFKLLISKPVSRHRFSIADTGLGRGPPNCSPIRTTITWVLPSNMRHWF